MSEDEFKQKIVEIKKAIAESRNIMYNGGEYKPAALILRHIQGEWLYSVELHSLKARSIVIARVIDVEVKERGKR